MNPVAPGALTVAAAAARRTTSKFIDMTDLDRNGDGRSADLPCPWCLGPTSEDDEFCPTCEQPFGASS